MHGNTVLGGPIWWLSVALLVLTWALAIYVSLDTMRAARAEALAKLPETRWTYFVPSVVFLAVSLTSQFAGLAWLSIAQIIAAPFVFVLGMVYLLRVVFPKSPSEG